VLTAFASLAAAPAAAADGLPVLGIDVGGVGVVAPAASARYVTLAAGANTVVARVATTGGMVLRSRVLKGTFTIPAVAYDGSASGLSHDGKTLVLIEPRRSFPRLRTRLLVLDASSLSATRLIDLKGDFSFDAISPLGSWVYLIQYLSPTDPTRYLVRAFDVRSGRFAPAPVIDPRAPREKMRGNPLSRVMSTDGRWAYTLYDGAGSAPFVHALDTSTRSARCIDLDALAGTDLSRLTLRFDEHAQRLDVDRGRARVQVVDLRTFEVSGDSGRTAAPYVRLAALALGSIAAAMGAVLFWRRRRRSFGPTRGDVAELAVVRQAFAHGSGGAARIDGAGARSDG
jgi:hypothetical protein